MPDIKKKDILKWAEIIFSPEYEFIQEIADRWSDYKRSFIDQIGENLYTDLKRSSHLFNSPFDFSKEFCNLSASEKDIWFESASRIPVKLKSLNLFIRPYLDFCRTCIITDKEIESISRLDHDFFCGKQESKGWKHGQRFDEEKKTDPAIGTFRKLAEERKKFYLELNYSIPLQLKKIGYEIVRPEEAAEIDMVMIKKLARAIHSSYLQKIRNPANGTKKGLDISLFHYPGELGNQFPGDFENLPDDIQLSNKDNAYHIPTKLLSIGYKIRHVAKGYKPITLHLSQHEVETMARVEHIRWGWDKRLNGWVYGKIKDNEKKTHPGLLPYEILSESEKEKDRELVRLIPALLQDIDFEAYPVNPNRIKKLSYAIKPQSAVHTILDETREMNEQIRSMVRLTPEVEEMVRIRNKKIEEAINEVQGSYTYAQHIQQAFLPDDLYVRECFTESFILYKPKDIVSGDFYFFCKRDSLIIFAAVDCTGHGIPGALLSTIGYGITDQAVNEKNITDPSLILQHLYSKVHRFLRWDEDRSGMSDDMDIVLCTLDLKTNILTYAGVRNPLYRVSEGEMIEYKAKNSKVICVEDGKCPFISEKIQLKPGDTFYLCSDGYADQFGGKNHKKYQTVRFKSFLLSLQDYSMPEQSDRLYEEIEQWREENHEVQTDDILVIGIRI
jgi:serine phosphatase RsbU (regulator of sigma subunit)